jgi:predicted nuclease of predicted toxin-antitoxin system
VKVLVDTGVGARVEAWLHDEGHDVAAVRLLNARMPDEDILALAVGEGRLVLTMDKDFGEWVYASGRRHCGVLLLRLQDADGALKAAVVAEIFGSHAQELPGRFSVYRSGRLRVRG